MRRSHYLVIILLLIAQTSFGQIYQNMAQPGYKFSRARFDSVLSIPIGLGNLKNISGGQDTGQIRFNKSDSSVYVWNGRAWIKAGGGTIPTLTQVLESAAGANEAGANQIKDLAAGTADFDAVVFKQLKDTANLRLKISDTASMLTNYSRIKSIGLTMPSAFNVANSPLTSSGTLAVTGAGTASQYVRGDGTLATLPDASSGGSSISYYLNGGTAASVGTYFQMSKNAVVGTNADFTRTGNGLISQFLTDVGDPNRLQIPAGNWNFEMFFSMSSSGGTPQFYVELLKYDGTTFTSIASSSAIPETISSGTSIDLYLTSLAIPTTTLLATDRLALRVYIVNNSGGRTATLHTQDSHLCQIITNFAGGVSALNGLTANTQYFATGTSGTDFNISSATDTHTLNLPTASATNTGKLSSTDWSTFNSKLSVTDTSVFSRKLIAANRQTASYTLALTDINLLVELNVGTANTLTVPLNSVVAFAIGTKIDIAQYGAGQTTITPISGVTIRSFSGALKIAGQYAAATLVKIGTNEWYCFGNLTL